MELSRRQTLSVLGVTAVAVALPASAASAATPPEILDIIYFPDNEGRVLAIVKCQVPVVSVTASLFNQDSTVRIGDYPMQLGPDGNPLWGLWLTAPLTGIPLGNYWMYYEATSADGGVAATSLEFFLWLTPTFTAQVTPAAIDQTNRVVTVSGTVVGRHPLTQGVAPIAGLPVEIRSTYWTAGLPNAPMLLVSTAADGTFTGQLNLADAALIRVGSGGAPRDLLVGYGAADTMQVPINKRSARLTANLTATTVNQGEPTTVNGLLEEFSEGQWRPMAGRVVRIGFVQTPSGVVHSSVDVVSDSEGRFLTAVTPPVTGYYRVIFDDRFYTPATVLTAAVVVLRPVRFPDEHLLVRRSRLGSGWEISGAVDTPSSAQAVAIQFRRSAAYSWQTLTTVMASPFPMAGGCPFSARFTPPTVGQVRAYAAPTAETQAGASKIVFVAPATAPERPEHNPDGNPPPPQRPQFEDDGPVRRP